MKANFKIENDDSDKNKDDESIKKIEDKDEEYYHIEIDELKHEIYELKMALKKRD